MAAAEKVHAPKVSVIMPAYNVAPYIRQCMDGVIGQTLRDIEIICVDDGSKDDTAEILDSYAKADPRVRVIRQKNGGAGAARNNGMQYARGEYLSILDSDDFYEPDMLEKSYLAAKQHDADIVVFGCDYYDEAKQSFRACSNAVNRAILPKQDVFCAADVSHNVFRLFVGWSWDKLFRREFVERHGLLFQEQRTTNDMLFVFSALILADRIHVMPQLLAHHRRTSGTLSVTRENSWICFYDALLALREHLKEYGLYQRYEQDYVNYALHFSMWHLHTMADPAYTSLYNKLRTDGFRELGVADYPPERFYDRYAYRQAKKILALPPEKNPATGLAGWADGNFLQRAIKGVADHGVAYTLDYAVTAVKNRIARK